MKVTSIYDGYERTQHFRCPNENAKFCRLTVYVKADFETSVMLPKIKIEEIHKFVTGHIKDVYGVVVNARYFIPPALPAKNNAEVRIEITQVSRTANEGFMKVQQSLASLGNNDDGQLHKFGEAFVAAIKEQLNMSPEQRMIRKVKKCDDAAWRQRAEAENWREKVALVAFERNGSIDCGL